MHHTSELVRSVLLWALSIVHTADTSDRRIPGPRLSQMLLGSLMSRGDMTTCIAIAREIAALERETATDEYMASLIVCIQSSWGATPRSSRRRTGREGSYEKASLALGALRRFGTPEQRSFIETCTVLKTWKRAEGVYPGRVWSSIRDDYETLSRQLYLKETMTICQVAEYITVSGQAMRRAA